MKARLQSMGFTLGHLQVIGAGILAIAILFLVDSAISGTGLFQKEASDFSQTENPQDNSRLNNARTVADFSEKLRKNLDSVTSGIKGGVLGNSSEPSQKTDYFEPRGAPNSSQ